MFFLTRKFSLVSLYAWRLQRQCAIVACKAYCTVRTETVLMMQHRLPIDQFVIYKFISRMVKKFKNLNDIPIETPVDWLNTIPPLRWFNLEHIEYSDRVGQDFGRLIYVDGTVKENRVGGCYLICTTRITEEQDFRLPDWCSVFQAKTYSINLELNRLIEKEVQSKAIVVLCNDKNVLLRGVDKYLFGNRLNLKVEAKFKLKFGLLIQDKLARVWQTNK